MEVLMLPNLYEPGKQCISYIALGSESKLRYVYFLKTLLTGQGVVWKFIGESDTKTSH